MQINNLALISSIYVLAHVARVSFLSLCLWGICLVGGLILAIYSPFTQRRQPVNETRQRQNQKTELLTKGRKTYDAT